MTSKTIRIARRFRGPATSVNGGYGCGLLAREIDGGAEITLRAPPPVETDLVLARDDAGKISLKAGETLVADAMPVELSIDVPAPVSWAEAEAVAAPWADHALPECFVCGPARAAGDGLRWFGRPVPGRDVIAAPFTPLDIDCENGIVRPEIVWSYLDCPSGLPLWFMGGWTGVGLLGRLAGRIDKPLVQGGRYIGMGWISRQEGRKGFTGSALVGEDGTVHAVGRGTWIRLRD